MSYFKIIGDNYGNYPYKMFLNTLADNGEEFNPMPVCGPGGLYFCEAKFIYAWVGHGDTLCRISIPEGAQVVAVENKFKADQIVIEEKFDLADKKTHEYLLAQGADYKVNPYYITRFIGKIGSHELTEWFIERGMPEAQLGAIMESASYYGNLKLVLWMLKERNVSSRGKEWSLYRASEMGYAELVRLLLIHNNPGSIDRALERAACYGRVEIVKILLEHGTSKFAQEESLAISREKGLVAVSSILEQSLQPKRYCTLM